jgi:hypothetical protein
MLSPTKAALVLKSLGCNKIIPGVCGWKGEGDLKALAVGNVQFGIPMY